ncbi:MAG: hypothetical protein ACR2HJ_08975 [Fimbriimonadales bacterium]
MIRDQVHLKLKDKRLATFSVFIPMVLGDKKAPAEESAKKMKRAGISSYWDGGLKLGRAYGKVVELPEAKTLAWDVYFVYGPDAVWGEAPPKPAYWMHQLGSDERCLDPDKFREAVKKELMAMGRSRLALLTRGGCTGTSEMRKNLDAALKKLEGGSYDVLDLDVLPMSDPRRGYPTPTLLRGGKDIFGMSEPKAGADAPG